MEKKLQRNTQEGALAGVCAGLAEYTGIDKIWVRLFFIVITFFSIFGFGLMSPVVYIVLWIVLPVKPLVFPGSPFSVNDQLSTGNQAAGTTVQPFSRPYKKSNDRQIAGIILLLIGAFFLLRQLEFSWWHHLVKFWPVIIILLGAYILMKAFDTRTGKAESFSQGDEPGPGSQTEQNHS